MDITHSLKHSMLAVGATPVLWLLLALSVASIAVIRNACCSSRARR